MTKFFESLPPLALAAVLALPTLDTATADDGAGPVVARVDTYEIHKADIDEARTRIPQRLSSVPESAIYPLLVNSLIDGRLVADAARKAGLENDAEVKRKLSQIKDQVLQRVQYARVLKERLTDEMIQTRYRELVEDQKGQKEVRARHILVETEDQATAVIAELDKGGDFAELAQTRSIGPSGPRGGDLGHFKKGDMVPSFAEAAFALDVGGVTKAPVKTKFGWHIIKVEDKRDAAPPTFEEVEGSIRDSVGESVITNYLHELRGKTKIEIFNSDGSPIAEK